jgi:very-short-patch-repair endonuclease
MDYQTIKRVPTGHWDNFSNHIQFRNYMAAKLEIMTPDDWYGVSTNTIRKMGGNGLLNSKYSGQTLKFLAAVLPEITWYPWLFKTPLKTTWKTPSTHKLFLDWLGNRLGFTTRRDYYKITMRTIIDNNGAGILVYYNTSPVQLVTTLLSPPEGDDEWYPWLFDGDAPNKYWCSIENQRKYADWLFKRLGFTKMEDWYTVSQNTFRNNYGSGLVLNPRTYKSSHIAFLSSVYPDYTFHPWLFQQTTQGYWKHIENRKRAIKWLGEQCGFTTADDWYRITTEDIRRNSLGGLLAHYYKDSMARMIVELNPELSLDITKFIVHKTEAKLMAYLNARKIRYNTQYKIHPGRKNGWFKMDIYLPDLNICIELDGAQHFRQVRKWLDPGLQKRRDVFKMMCLKEKGLQCIRLLQEEVLNQCDSWLDTHLLPHLSISDTAEPLYIVTLSENSILYDEHKELYIAGSISIDELYSSDEDEDEDEEL